MFDSAAYQRAYRAKNRERLRKRDREYVQKRYANDPEFKKKILEYQSNVYKKNRFKIIERVKSYSLKNREAKRKYFSIYQKKERLTIRGKARTFLGHAIRDKRIVRPNNCSKCLKECVPHGHHPDYTKPLEVIWLCSLCHGKEHSRLR